MKIKFLNLGIAIGMLVLFTSCKSRSVTNLPKEELLYRPSYHFSPDKGWMNDPNGLYYLDGTYHLFFQYYPNENKWGPMHWGHAISNDLVKWEHQPVALYPDDLGYIFSGSAVVDKNNTSGFGNGKNTPVIAIFTYHNMEKEKANQIDVETQGIAYSLDNGKSWTKYSNNPVLKNPGIRDFRDPKVFWDDRRNQWVMVVAAQDRAHFYASKNLKEWTFLSAFGEKIGAHGGVWECPDIFPLKVAGTNEEKWVLIININPGGMNGGSAAQYFVGDFDGKTFKIDDGFQKQIASDGAKWLDFGRDNYASVSFSDMPQNDRTIIGWMSNWDYSQSTPTKKWRNAATIARTVKLERKTEGYLLKTMPVSQIKNYSKNLLSKDVYINKNTVLLDKKTDLTKVNLDLKLTDLDDAIYSFTLKNQLGEKLIFGLDNKNKNLFVDRRKSGNTIFKENFADRISQAPLPEKYKEASMKVLLDKTSLEIFFNNGERVMTEIFFPDAPYTELSVSSEVSGAKLHFNASQINLK